MSEQDYKNIFAKNLKYYMGRDGATQMDLAKYLQVSQSTVSSWCNAEKMPRMDKVQALGKYFHCKNSDLLEEKTKSEDTDDFRDRMKEEYGVLFDLIDKASDYQRELVEDLLRAFIEKDEE